MPVPYVPFGFEQIEFDRYISPDGREYHFNDGITRFIWGQTGRGMARPTVRTQRGPFQDGNTALGFVLQPRVIQMIHRRNEGTRQLYYDGRADLLNELRINRQPTDVFQLGVLRKILPNGDMRDLEVYLETGLTFRPQTTEAWDEWSIMEGLRFIANNPVFFDPTQNQQDLSIPTTTEELAFSITFPITFSSSGGSPTDTINYAGTFKSFPTFTLQGPLTEPLIENLTTREKIQFTNTILVGRTVTVDLAFGNKTVTDDLNTNLIGSISSDSDLATFHLAPDPEAASGVNSLGITATGVTAASRIAMSWFTRDIGV